MTPYEKSSLTATWLQTIAVIVGITFALFQMNQAQRSLEQTEGIEISTLLNRFTAEYSDHYEAIYWFYRQLGEANSYRDETKISESLEQLLTQLDPEAFGSSSGRVLEYFELVSNCIDSGICTDTMFRIRSCQDIQAIERHMGSEKNELQIAFIDRYEPMNEIFSRRIGNLESALCQSR